MARIVSNFFISMDGVVERPDQWHFPYFDDEMGEIMKQVGGDGFLITSPVMRLNRRYVTEITDGLIPELQKRGAYPTAYRPGTLREKLFGEGPYLPKTHPADGYRDIEAVKRREAEAVPALKSVGA